MKFTLLNKATLTFPSLVFSLFLTILFYGAFPLIFANNKRKETTEKKYKFICYSVNFCIMVFIIFLKGSPANSFAYVLWTWASSKMGIKILKSRDLITEKSTSNAISARDQRYLDELESNGYINSDTIKTAPTVEQTLEKPLSQEENPTTENDKILFCRKCGVKLIENCNFCHKCGTEVFKQ